MTVGRSVRCAVVLDSLPRFRTFATRELTRPLPVMRKDHYNASGMTRARAAGRGSEPTRAGEGKPVLVMLHGFALDARMWRRQAYAFSSEYRIVTLDLPGFGPQAREVGEVAPATEMARAMKAAGVDRAHLIASSYGAAVAVDYALEHVDRVAS